MAKTVMDFLYDQPGFAYAFLDIRRIEHLAVAICHGRKIQRGHCQSKSCRLILLSIP